MELIWGIPISYIYYLTFHYSASFIDVIPKENKNLLHGVQRQTFSFCLVNVNDEHWEPSFGKKLRV